MYRLLVQAIIAVLIIIVISQWIVEKRYGKYIIVQMMLVYIGFVIYITMFSGARGYEYGINLRPPLHFYWAVRNRSYGSTTNRSVLNCLLFAPFGYLLPLIYQYWNCVGKKNALSWYVVTVLGFFSSLVIEVCQLLFHRGVFELDDLMKNTMGAVAGYLVWKVLENKSCKG